uniref:tRNA-dihydrouridine(47) synthase [NAD(P)(+)] n=1 Tax=Pyramimonas obovata TaxID=1411642 RepID=A0A7S0MSZ6_9CHLO|mmetsp:Transcript_10784/g.22477  ORF Transcript_10784/g.22477 Transcript_10784/m.22477 type:complete len:636 (+) Transcript_10784:155-2062(+)|eukprot:CAMPEP_0118939616 /NCGR_PEP_ID=MMETSP1169-20130426/29343_1 /TAXON_ID=36882 /ORGANISM="Pyramimonas obovata, Strain CCMP722" /LENGTH=635 /DNA_ID=CAMNT_0006883923 /DNA_START=61 /DNA_END=1968 /DNA_ORIENTATION=-
MAETNATEVLKRTPEELQDLISRGEAPVKREYLVAKKPAPPKAEEPTEKKPTEERSNDRRPKAEVKNQERFGKSKRQQKRERNEAKTSGNNLCQAYAGGRCTFGDTCRFSHDLDKFLASKRPDLPGSCPFASQADGKCPYGVMCRYYNSHPGAEAKPVSKPQDGEATEEAPPVEAIALPVPTTIEKETNFFSKDLQTSLRKKQFDFSPADKKLKAMGIFISRSYDNAIKSAEPAKDEAEEGQREVKRARPADPAECVEGADVAPRLVEKKIIDFRDKLYLAPLTTVGNLPYRRICKRFGVDITCGEMAMVTNLLMGQSSELALLRRHPSEDLFGVQICGGYADSTARCVQLLEEKFDFDFVDINMGCPIDLVCGKGAGSSLLLKPKRIEHIVRACSSLMTRPFTVKTRIGWFDDQPVAHDILPNLRDWGAAAVTLHGRTRAQRYTRQADWSYIGQCAEAIGGKIPLIGNGDIYSYKDYVAAKATGVEATMIGRGALIKPWIFEEIKGQKDWDISGSERLDIIKQYCAYGLEHWGSDAKGVETTRRFMLEWMSFLYRYIPLGLLEVAPAELSWRPPAYVARDDREALLSSSNPEDWIKLSRMLLGPTPDGFHFAPKHKSNAYGGASQTEMDMEAEG